MEKGANVIKLTKLKIYIYKIYIYIYIYKPYNIKKPFEDVRVKQHEYHIVLKLLTNIFQNL